MYSRYSQILSKRAFSSSVGAGKSVGFVGLGCMGLPMSGNLKANGYNVKAYDLMPEARQAASDAGINTVDSLAKAVSEVDYVITALPKTEHVAEVLKMEGGIFQSASPNTLICDVSTIDPDGARGFYDEAKTFGMTYIDTPMSGGTLGANAATLTFMVGGSEEEFEAAKGVLTGMGKNFFHCGGPGSGEIAKLTNNLILGISMVGASEGMAIGEKLGINPVTLQKILAVSTARSYCIDTNNPRPGVFPHVPASNNYEGGFAVGLIKKDMNLALNAAKSCNADTSLLEQSMDYYQALEDAGEGKKDFGYVFQYIMNNKEI